MKLTQDYFMNPIKTILLLFMLLFSSLIIFAQTLQQKNLSIEHALYEFKMPGSMHFLNEKCASGNTINELRFRKSVHENADSRISRLGLQNDDLGILLCYRFNVALTNRSVPFLKKKKQWSFPEISFRLMAGII